MVLFFSASWCPTCQEATEQLTGAEFPDGLTVVSVDHDSNEALRDKYGVTTQHTFVVIDSEGRETKVQRRDGRRHHPGERGVILALLGALVAGSTDHPGALRSAAVAGDRRRIGGIGSAGPEGDRVPGGTTTRIRRPG